MWKTKRAFLVCDSLRSSATPHQDNALRHRRLELQRVVCRRRASACPPRISPDGSVSSRAVPSWGSAEAGERASTRVCRYPCCCAGTRDWVSTLRETLLSVVRVLPCHGLCHVHVLDALRLRSIDAAPGPCFQNPSYRLASHQTALLASMQCNDSILCLSRPGSGEPQRPADTPPRLHDIGRRALRIATLALLLETGRELAKLSEAAGQGSCGWLPSLQGVLHVLLPRRCLASLGPCLGSERPVCKMRPSTRRQ